MKSRNWLSGSKKTRVVLQVKNTKSLTNISKNPSKHLVRRRFPGHAVHPFSKLASQARSSRFGSNASVRGSTVKNPSNRIVVLVRYPWHASTRSPTRLEWAGKL
jgi:hypothetical protein